MIITKPASELKMGDVFILGVNMRHVVLTEPVVNLTDGTVGFADAAFGMVAPGSDRCNELGYLHAASEVRVVVQDLTPAQQHADELVALVRHLSDPAARANSERMVEGRALLERIDPPKPPTLEEALDLLHKLTYGDKKQDYDAAVLLLARVPK